MRPNHPTHSESRTAILLRILGKVLQKVGKPVDLVEGDIAEYLNFSRSHSQPFWVRIPQELEELANNLYSGGSVNYTVHPSFRGILTNSLPTLHITLTRDYSSPEIALREELGYSEQQAAKICRVLEAWVKRTPESEKTIQSTPEQQ